MCKDCRFYDSGLCKVYPPTVLLNINEDIIEGDVAAIKGDEDFIYKWPAVRPTDFCGQFEFEVSSGSTQSMRGLRT